MDVGDPALAVTGRAKAEATSGWASWPSRSARRRTWSRTTWANYGRRGSSQRGVVPLTDGNPTTVSIPLGAESFSRRRARRCIPRSGLHRLPPTGRSPRVRSNPCCSCAPETQRDRRWPRRCWSTGPMARSRHGAPEAIQAAVSERRAGDGRARYRHLGAAHEALRPLFPDALRPGRHRLRQGPRDLPRISGHAGARALEHGRSCRCRWERREQLSGVGNDGSGDRRACRAAHSAAHPSTERREERQWTPMRR